MYSTDIPFTGAEMAEAASLGLSGYAQDDSQPTGGDFNP
jgi:hypothetical protein